VDWAPLLTPLASAAAGGVVTFLVSTWFRRRDDQRQQKQEEREATKHLIDLWRSTAEVHEKRQRLLSEELEHERETKSTLKKEIDQLKSRLDTDASMLRAALVAIAGSADASFDAASHLQKQFVESNQALRREFMTDICSSYGLDLEQLQKYMKMNEVPHDYEIGVLAIIAFDRAMFAGMIAQHEVLLKYMQGLEVLDFIHDNPQAQPGDIVQEVLASMVRQLKRLEFEENQKRSTAQEFMKSTSIFLIALLGCTSEKSKPTVDVVKDVVKAVADVPEMAGDPPRPVNSATPVAVTEGWKLWVEISLYYAAVPDGLTKCDVNIPRNENFVELSDCRWDPKAGGEMNVGELQRRVVYDLPMFPDVQRDWVKEYRLNFMYRSPTEKRTTTAWARVALSSNCMIDLSGHVEWLIRSVPKIQTYSPEPDWKTEVPLSRPWEKFRRDDPECLPK
jgi:hypothetical protein